MSALILKLALQAMTDDDALPVLGDAIVEARWYSPHLPSLIMPTASTEAWPMWLTGDSRWWLDTIRDIGHDGARAVAAVMLFEGWPTSWPLADQAHDGDILIYTGGRFRNGVRVDAPIQVVADPGVDEGTAFMVASGTPVRIINIGRSSLKESNDQ